MKTIAYPEEARRKVLMGGGGFTPAWDTKLVLWLAGQTQGAILEIGCNEGWLTRELAMEYPKRRVLGVDWVPPTVQAATMCAEQRGEMPREVGSVIKAGPYPNTRVMNRNSRELNYCELVREHGGIGFVFIDGDHSYEGVKADTEKALYALMHVDAGGPKIIAWHDAYPDAPGWCGVWRYLQELSAERPSLNIQKVDDSWIAFGVVG